MADVAIRKTSVTSAPNNYLIPGAQEIVVRSVNASMDGTSAGVPWFPCLEILDPAGNVLMSAVATSSVAAGASADVSWFPGVSAAGTSGPDSDVLPWPAGNPAHEVVDSTSWVNNFDGSGFYTALALDINNTGTVAVAGYQGDAFPFMIVGGPARNGDFPVLYLGDGTVDPVGGGNAAGFGLSTNSSTHQSYATLFGNGRVALSTTDMINHNTSAALVQCLILNDNGSGAQQIQVVAGTGVPTLGARVGDLYYRRDGTTGTLFYQCTVAGGDGVATWAAVL